MGLGFRVRVQGSGFRVQGSGFRVQGSGFRVQGSGFRVQGSGFRVQGSGFKLGNPRMRAVLGIPWDAKRARGGDEQEWQHALTQCVNPKFFF